MDNQNNQLFDPKERAAKKQASRDQDERDLASGKISREEMQKRNGFIPGDIARSAKILKWKEMD